MAEWQNDELSGLDNIVYIIAIQEDARGDEPDGDDLLRWQEEHGFRADALVLDGDRRLMDAYIRDNPGPTYSQAITVIFDTEMRIRRVGGTYDTNHDQNLALLLELAAGG